MRERLIDWLAAKATDYFVWVHERDLSRAHATEDSCPDCDQPESYCSCSDRETRIAEDAFDAGYERAMEARR